MKKEENICPFCGEKTDKFPNDGYAHYDCARDFSVFTDKEKEDIDRSFVFGSNSVEK